jgi:methionyl-tRNA formyltransferase
MRIELLTHDDPHYTLPFFEEFFRNYAGEFEIVHVSVCRAMGNRKRSELLRALLNLYGPVGMARLAASVACARALAMLPRTRRARRFYSLRQLCQAFDVPCDLIGNPNQPEILGQIRARKPDLILSVACPFLIKKDLLGLPPLGCVNIHHAPLPRYRGMMPTFWQMYHDERTVGVTVHYMGEKFDDGGILLQEDLAIEPGEGLDVLIRRSKRHGAHCVARVLRQIATGSQTILAPEPIEPSYFTFPTIEEIREFRRRGYRAI